VPDGVFDDLRISVGDLLQSYGGGLAAHVIGDTSTTFTCGLSVAPVATKAYYGQSVRPWLHVK